MGFPFRIYIALLRYPTMDYRCFIAIELPQLLRKKLARVAAPLPHDAVNFVDERNMHITLKFLGEVSQDKLAAVKQRLEQIKAKPFTVKVRGAGVFPNEDYVRVVWVGCQGDRLTALAKKINEALSPLFKPEEFAAHITVARVKRKIPIRDFLASRKDQELGEFKVERFLLMVSKLTPAGPEYSVLAEYKLD
jgi:2'-5' RNA ligase